MKNKLGYFYDRIGAFPKYIFVVLEGKNPCNYLGSQQRLIFTRKE